MLVFEHFLLGCLRRLELVIILKRTPSKKKKKLLLREYLTLTHTHRYTLSTSLFCLQVLLLCFYFRQSYFQVAFTLFNPHGAPERHQAK